MAGCLSWTALDPLPGATYEHGSRWSGAGAQEQFLAAVISMGDHHDETQLATALHGLSDGRLQLGLSAGLREGVRQGARSRGLSLSVLNHESPTSLMREVVGVSMCCVEQWRPP
ncbi:hypothetical protein Vretimale_4366, partial [Volvox reticuliferus]